MKHDYKKIFEEGVKAGIQAANDCTPTPMVVGTPKDVFGKTIDISKPIYIVKGGMCGFASVKGIDGCKFPYMFPKLRNEQSCLWCNG